MTAPASARLYHVVVRNDRTGEDTRLTAYACLHHEAVTIKSKQRPDRERPAHLRCLLVEAP